MTLRLIRWIQSALPDVVDEPQKARTRRGRVAEVLVYVYAFVVGSATLIDTWELHPDWLRPITVAVGLAGLVSLRWRRSHPPAVGITVAALSAPFITLSGANHIVLFNAAVRGRGRHLAVIAGLMVVWACVNPLLYPPDIPYGLDAGAGLLMVAVAVGWGLFVRARRALLRSLSRQAERATDEAREAERRRIAREMHDVLAHRLSLLSVHAGALEFKSDAPPEEVAEAAGVIRESARAALEDLRGVIGVLREDDAETHTEPPQPTLAELPALIEESRAAGMRINASVDAGGAPEAVGRAVYRIVQEGLTNARKHAPGATVTLTVDAAGDDVRVEVRTPAPVTVVAAPLPGAGTGLIGLAERVALADGELEHGVDGDGSFVLRARLPR